jgi:hypothetical protein
MKSSRLLKLNNRIPDSRRISRPVEKDKDSTVVKRAIKQRIRNMVKKKLGK